MDDPPGLLNVDDIWPDPDRREGALERLERRVLFDERTPNRSDGGGHPTYEGTRYDITAQERRVLAGLAGGLTRQETADVLDVTIESVKHSVKYAKRKLHAKTLPQLTANAVRRGLIP